jgi:hypothetical protein
MRAAPRAFVSAASVACARYDVDGLWPHSNRQPVRGKSGVPMSTPNV